MRRGREGQDRSEERNRTRRRLERDRTGGTGQEGEVRRGTVKDKRGTK